MSESSVTCPSCGALVGLHARFCTECGFPMPLPDAPPTVPPLPTHAASAAVPAPGTVVGMPAVRPTHTLELDLSATAPPESVSPSARAVLGAVGAHAGTSPERPAEGDAAPLSEVLGALDGTFQALVEGRAGGTERTEADVAEVQALFRQVAAEHAGPVRDFLIELRLGEPSKEWLDVVTPALLGLRAATEQVGMVTLQARIDGLAEALQAADRSPGTTVGGEARARVLEAWAPLEEELPELFAHSAESDRREPIILRSLLQQVPGVRKVQLDRIFRAGLTRLPQLYAARAEELAVATGLDHELCAAIVDRVTRYRDELAGFAPDPARGPERRLLEDLVSTLAQQHEVYENGAVDRRRARQDRAETLTQVELMLARLGAVDLVQRLERVPFEKKLSLLREYAARGAG